MYNNCKVRNFDGGVTYTLVQREGFPNKYKVTWKDEFGTFKESDYTYNESWITDVLEKGTWVLAGTELKDTEQYTGSSSNYYKVYVKHPTTLPEPYEAECNDIIESLQMTFAEGNAFKAIWRKAKARQGVKKKGYDNGVYDSEKVVFFGERMLIEAKDNE